MAKSRRRARRAALRALYEIEIGKTRTQDAIDASVEELELGPDLLFYTERLVNGVREHQADLDKAIGGYLKDYDFSRLATVDRNILRIAAFELFHVPEMPPAVSIDEAIEIAKQYSTSESGRFVNGVLGNLLKSTPKANWDPATAPKEEQEEFEAADKVEVEELDVTPDDPNFRAASRVGGWKIRSEE